MGLWARLSEFCTRRVVFVAVCNGVILTSAVPYAFNTYSDGFKAWYNMTQWQVELLSSVSVTSAAINLPTGLFYDAFGVLPSMLVTLVACTGGYGLLWLATRWTAFFSERSWLLCVFVAISGQGRTLAHIVGLTEAALAVRPIFTSVTVALCETAVQVGALGYSFAYQVIFVQGHIQQPRHQRFDQFFLYLTGWSFFAYTLFTLILVSMRKSTNDTEEIELRNALNSASVNIDARTPLVNSNTVYRTAKSAIFTCSYQLLFWSTVLACSALIFTDANLAFITRTLALSEYNTSLFLPNRVVTTLTRFGLGVLLTRMERCHVLGEYCLLIFNIVTVISQIMLFKFGENVPVLFVSVLTASSCLGAFYVLSPVLIVRYFGLNKFARIMPFLFSAVPLLSVIIHVVFARVYESQISRDGEIYCYGIKCLLGALYTSTFVGVMGAIFATSLCIKKSNSSFDGYV